MNFFETDAELTALPKFGRAVDGWSIVDKAMFWLFVAGLAWVPLWYGGNVPLAWGTNAVFFPGLAALYELSIALPGRRHPVGCRALAVPAALFGAVILWISLQSVTWLPGSLANPIWGMAADALGKPLAASISVNRDLTALALVRLLTAASVFWLAVQLCRDGARANRLIAGIALIGGLYAAYGILAAKTGQLGWSETPVAEGHVTSTFVNENSYATFAGMGLIAAAGLLIRAYQRRAIDGGGWRLRLAAFIEVSGREAAWLISTAFVSLVALLLTGSRGGVLSTGAGLALVGALASWRERRHRRRPVGAIALILGLVVAALLVFGDIFVRHLDASGLADSNRLAVFVLTVRSILDVPLLGFGYGTFADVFPLYRDQSISVQGAWLQAHDSYIEQLQGLGLIFGAMLIVALGLLALRCLRGAIQRRENATVPLVAIGAACLVGLHAAADFSLQIQAVTLTFMALLGAGIAQSTSSRIDIGD